MATKKQTAAECYAQRQDEVGALLDLIGQEAKAHAERAAAEPRHWGYPGSLGHLRDLLVEALAFISGMPEQAVRETLDDLQAGREARAADAGVPDDEREALEAELDRAVMAHHQAGTQRDKDYWQMRIDQIRAQIDD